MGTYENQVKNLERRIQNLFQMHREMRPDCACIADDEAYWYFVETLYQMIGNEYQKINQEVIARKMMPLSKIIQEYLKNDRSGDDSVI